MNKQKIIAITCILLLFTVLVSGCIGQTDTAKKPNIKSSEQASEAASNISTGVEDISSTLEEIDKGLG